MKPVKIEHDRCNEYAGTTFGWVPDEMTEEKFLVAVEAAQVAYQAFLNEYREKEKHRISFTGARPSYEEFPDKTVAEVKAQWELDRAKYNEQERVLSQGYKTFGDYLKPYGFVMFYDGEFDYEARVSWGHQHGTMIDMSDDIPSLQDLPGPKAKTRV